MAKVMIRALQHRLRVSRRPRAAVGAALMCATLAVSVLVPAASAASSGVVVTPHPAQQPALSYFKLSLRPGGASRAGVIELHNPSRQRMRVALAAVDGETLSTLGSGYAPAGTHAHGSTLWLRVWRQHVTLPAGARALVPVSVVVPRAAGPGDYLAGVSIEALNQHASSSAGKGLAIASVDRYAIGVEVSVPGPRRPLIQFTGATLERQPAGLMFLLQASNRGNVILQNVSGAAVITKGRRTIASVPLGPGTFVSATSIAYPILAEHQLPTQGTVYRVRAHLRYRGGVARLDTLVRFGHAAAVSQHLYGGPTAPSASPHRRGWLIVLAGAAAVAAAAAAASSLLIRRRAGARSPLRVLAAAAEASRLSGGSLSLIVLSLPAGAEAARRLAPALRARMRRADRLCRLSDGRLLVVAPDTDAATAEALAVDLRRQLERAGAESVATDVRCGDGDLTAGELLALVNEPDGDPHVLTPSG
jgi:hypothetical protein